VGVKSFRLVALALSFALIAFYAVPLYAQPLPDRVAGLLKDVCVSPSTPEGMIEVGGKIAAIEGWKLLGAAPAPLPFMHNENGPRISFQSTWELSLSDGSQAHLSISIVRPELPGVRHSICLIEPASKIEPDILAQALEQSLGDVIVRDTRQWTGSRKWFFAEERQRGNCGRQILLFERGQPSLVYFDAAYPNDGNWNLLLSETVCRS
jgi:hypothetical protein